MSFTFFCLLLLNKLQGVRIIVKILLCQTLLHPCLTQQDFYNNRNTLQFIHLSLKANHYILDLKPMNQKIRFCFLAYLLISYNRYFQLT